MYHRYPDPSGFNPFAVEGTGTRGANGIVPRVDPDEADPEWQPL